jgi:GrpB-like predicted nucleotidyltransferase (UPF0157 family)
MSHSIHFIPMEQVADQAKQLFAGERARILEVSPEVSVEHVGSSAIPGAFTLGDLDIQVRVGKKDFSSCVVELSKLYHRNRPELWTPEFALFHQKDHPELPMSIILTVIDSPFDDFSASRDYLIQHPEVLSEYNALKSQYEGKSYEEYRSAKRAFFGPNGNNRLLK